MHIFFLAKGTRGDVQPVALLAHALRARDPRLLLHFVTHCDHQVSAHQPERLAALIALHHMQWVSMLFRSRSHVLCMQGSTGCQKCLRAVT